MASLIRFVRGKFVNQARRREQQRLAQQPAPLRLDRADWDRSLREPTEFYLDCFRFFRQRLDPELTAHRAFFFKGQRGFGEDAFHTMWFLLFQEFKPANFLEIGVFRGQTLSLAALLARQIQIPCQVQGISPFTPADDTVSKYRKGVDYLTETLANFEHFQLPRPQLLKAFSTDAKAVALIRSRSWEVIYIDGNHDYEVTRQDWEVCSQSVRPGGIIVLDDAGLGTKFQPPVFATGGHPGPSRLAREIDPRGWHEILQVGHNRVFQEQT